MGCSGSKGASRDVLANAATAEVVRSKATQSLIDPSTWAGTARSSDRFADRYEVVKVLGQGAFGVVQQVTRLEDGATLAAKNMMRPVRGGKAWQRVEREIELWEAVSSPYHPAVLQLIEIVTSPEGCHLLTELMEHGELFDVLDNCAFSEQTCRMVAVQIASALAHLHLRHKVAHCDVKPANVLCRCADPTVPGSLKLADFGFCQRFTRRTARDFTITCGTFEYFAPELVANRNSQARNPQRSEGSPLVRYGSHVDCWSLGCVVYEMLHGEPPYYSKDDEAQLQLIAAHELHFPDESFGQVSTQGKEFIRGLLEAEPSSRFLIEEALRHPWLQPVTDENTRNVLSLKLPDGAIERRNARKHARQRLRAGIHSVVAARRLSRGSAQPDVVGSDGTEVVVQPLSSEALRAHSEQDVHDIQPASPSKGRRGSNASSASYHSDDMAPRAI